MLNGTILVCIMVCNGTNKSKIGNATDIDAVMQMHNLI